MARKRKTSRRGARGSVTIDAADCPQKLTSKPISTTNNSSTSSSEDAVVLGDDETPGRSADGTRHSDFKEQSHDHSSRRSPAMDPLNLLGDQSDSELSVTPSYLSSPRLPVPPDTQSVMETPLRPTVSLITYGEKATESPNNDDGSRQKQVTVDLDGEQNITRVSQNRDSIERVASQSFSDVGEAIDGHRDNLPIDLISSSANSQRDPSPVPVQTAPIRTPRKRLATSKIIAMEPNRAKTSRVASSPTQHGRKRTIPSDFDVDGPHIDLSAEVVSPKEVSKPKRARGVWTTEYLLQNEKSKLVDVDLTKLLSDPRAWASLSDAEKRGVLEHLPSHVGASLETNEVPSIPIDFLKYDNDWRNGLRLFQEDLSAGHFEPSWLEEAAEAMEARARGEFDDWKNAEYEAFWGQKQKLQYDVRAEDSARMKFGTLVNDGILKVGDIWSFTKTIVPRGGPSILIEKEAKCIGKDASSSLTFAVPPKQHKFSKQAADIILKDVSGPQKVETMVIQEDGRVKHIPNGNAWKSLRILRNNQDLGTLWDIREAYYIKWSKEHDKSEDDERHDKSKSKAAAREPTKGREKRKRRSETRWNVDD